MKLDSIKKVIPIEIEAALAKNPKIFYDSHGNESPMLRTKFKQQIIKKAWENEYRPWAKQVLTPKEYAYFSTIKFSYDQETGIPVISNSKSIEYDINWLFNFYDTSALVMSQMTEYEYLYYITSTEITGIKETPYINQFYSEDIEHLLLTQVIESAKEFFIIMHEFYHLYYGKENADSYQKEIEADKFALQKYQEAIPHQPGYANESEIISRLNGFKADGKKDQMFEAFSECNSEKLLNDGVTNYDFDSAFLGSNVIEVFLLPDSRFFLTNNDQLALDIKRTEYFHQVSLDALKCNSDTSSFFCCKVRSKQKELEELKKLLKISENFDLLAMKPEIERYKKMLPEDPARIAYAIGNQYAKQRKFNLALAYYQSVNQLNDNSNYSVLCNLLAYEITHNVKGYKNETKAKDFLENAKKMNRVTQSIRGTIINLLP